MPHLAPAGGGREHALSGMQDDEEPVLVTIRLAPYLLREAEDLMAKVATDKSTPLSLGGKVTRSDVLRLALARGLGMLREQYGGG